MGKIPKLDKPSKENLPAKFKKNEIRSWWSYNEFTKSRNYVPFRKCPNCGEFRFTITEIFISRFFKKSEWKDFGPNCLNCLYRPDKYVDKKIEEERKKLLK